MEHVEVELRLDDVKLLNEARVARRLHLRNNSDVTGQRRVIVMRTCQR